MRAAGRQAGQAAGGEGLQVAASGLSKERGTHLHEAWGWMDDEIRTGTPRLGLWIDSSAQTAEQTVDEIMRRVWDEGVVA